MGATRESSWSDGIFVGWSCGEDACAVRVDAMYTGLSPGTMAIVQTITGRYRRVALKIFRLGFMVTSALIARKVGLVHGTPRRAPEPLLTFCLQTCAAHFLHTRPHCFLAVLVKNTVEVWAGRTLVTALYKTG